MMGVKLVDDVKGFLIYLRSNSRNDAALVSGLAPGVVTILLTGFVVGLLVATWFEVQGNSVAGD